MASESSDPLGAGAVTRVFEIVVRMRTLDADDPEVAVIV
jgi:hypothetical protein